MTSGSATDLCSADVIPRFTVAADPDGEGGTGPRVSTAIKGGGRMTSLTAGPAPHAEMAAPNTGETFSPSRIVEVELTEPLPRLEPSDEYGSAFVLARLHTEPIGVVTVKLAGGGVSPDQLATQLWGELIEPIAERFVAAGLAAPAELTAAGVAAEPEAWPFLRNRSAALAGAPSISVVVCTRDRPAQLENCLERLARLAYPRFEVVIVDNAPTSDAVQTIVEGYADATTKFRYCREARPGLSWARNAGIAATASEIIAFVDDDDEPDERWLAGIAVGFARGDRIGCVSGMILPARLDTPAEGLFEQLGGHIKGRGFAKDTFSKSGPQSPLFPLPPFGTGANMAFRREVLERIGGFDVALGAGTPTCAGEDTLIISLTMLEGYEVAYEPSALMWHHHRQDISGLGRQLHGYSIGLTAFYAALLRRRPSAILPLLKLLPAAVGYLRSSSSAPDSAPDPGAALDRRQRQGMLAGPFRYINSVRKQRRASNVKPPPAAGLR
jgi:glycosyl transferase family 2